MRPPVGRIWGRGNSVPSGDQCAVHLAHLFPGNRCASAHLVPGTRCAVSSVSGLRGPIQGVAGGGDTADQRGLCSPPSSVRKRTVKVAKGEKVAKRVRGLLALGQASASVATYCPERSYVVASGLLLSPALRGRPVKVAKRTWQPWQSISHWDNKVLPIILSRPSWE